MNLSPVADIRRQLRDLADPSIAQHSQRFFKTGPSEYGKGDEFIGIRVPVLRRVAKQHRDIPLDYIEQLISSAIHEERLLALLILVFQFEHKAKMKGVSVSYRATLSTLRLRKFFLMLTRLVLPRQ